MKQITLSHFNKNITGNLKKVCKNDVPLIIEISENESVVILSLGEYNSEFTTFHEMNSVLNQKRLDSAI